MKLHGFIAGSLALAVLLGTSTLSESADNIRYADLAVFPLPDQPPEDLVGLYGVLREIIVTGSRLEEAQLVAWLGQHSPSRLKEITAAIPSPWVAGSNIPGLREFDQMKLTTLIDQVLAAHPDREEGGERMLGEVAYDAYRLAEEKWDEALAGLKAIGEGDVKSAYLLGMMRSASRAPSFTEAMAKLNTMGVSMESNLGQAMLPLWPIGCIEEYLRELSARDRKRWATRIVERGTWYFPEHGELLRFAREHDVTNPASSAAEAAGWRMAARSPDRFFAWWFAQQRAVRTAAIHQAVAPLLNHDVGNAKRILAGGGSYRLRKEWFRLDPVAAMKHFPDKTWRAPGLYPGAPIGDLVALYNESPGLNAEPYRLIAAFNPQNGSARDHADELLKLNDAKARRYAARIFAKKWGMANGVAAFAWATAIPLDPERKEWLRMILSGWAVVDREAAAAAIESLPAGSFGDTTREDILRGQHTRYTDRTPATYRLPADLKGAAFPTKKDGIEARVRLMGILVDLEKLAVPSAGFRGNRIAFPDRVLSAPLAACVLDLGATTVRGLVQELQLNPPRTARMREVQCMLIEGWALHDPRAAAEWMVFAAPNTFNSALPLAQSRLALVDPARAIALADHGADGLQRVAKTLAAAKGIPEAIKVMAEAGRPYDDALSAIWLRHDLGVAEAWRRSRWIFN